ncbi:ribonuclease P protein component [Oceanicoccus sagamiensis]|uniref:Ribonuclease P protein component n=1 Tax=Oceanicoccus sagamiensis TaxID=716816 RepID=A0A1X9N8I7_9GAMM|nr:ribonuclease P protein component [Oceanicoccus sagamiensis]ARN73996.1 ribonuclease P protein component [Oceanicoccus sagamiensis]
MINYSFNKSLRLLDATAYKAVFDNAQLKVSKQQVLYLACKNGTATPRLGLVIAKKNVRHATQRNRIKRILRESFRLQQHQLGGIDTVVLARRGLDQLDNTALHALFNKLWQQLYEKSLKDKNKADNKAKQQSQKNS